MKDTTKNKNQMIFKDSIFPGIVAGNIINVYFKSGTTNSGLTTLYNFSIKMGYTRADTFAYVRDTVPGHNPILVRLLSPFIKGLATVLSSPSYTIAKPVTNGSWVKFPLQTPFAYVPSTEQNLVLEISQGPDTPVNGFYAYGVTGTPYMQQLYGRAGSDTAAGAGGSSYKTLTGFGMAPAGINELRLISDFQLYPNPAGHRVNFSIEAVKPVKELSISAINSAGQQVYAKSYGAKMGKCNMEMDVSHLPKGLYYIRLRADDEVLVRSVVVE